MKNAQVSAISALTFVASIITFFFNAGVGYTVAVTGLALISLMTMNL